ncbi:MAG TPA: hypothetical protein VIK54_12640 [Acidimicrobiia bacterium]
MPIERIHSGEVAEGAESRIWRDTDEVVGTVQVVRDFAGATTPIPLQKVLCERALVAVGSERRPIEDDEGVVVAGKAR